MVIIDSSTTMARALDSPIDSRIRALLTLRRDQLLDQSDCDLSELGSWIIVQPGDPLDEVEIALNYPILPEPSWEWVLDHSGILEAPIILSDDGYGVVLIVPDEPGVDRVLVHLLRRDARAAETSGSDSERL